MNSLYNIVLSRFKTDQNQKWVVDRRTICASCPFNSLNTEKISFKMKVMKFLSDALTWVTRADNEEIGECVHPECGCSVFMKTKIKDEECPENKWKE